MKRGGSAEAGSAAAVAASSEAGKSVRVAVGCVNAQLLKVHHLAMAGFGSACWVVVAGASAVNGMAAATAGSSLL